MRDQEPTPWEAAFFAGVQAAVPGVQDWCHADDDGTLWMCVSYDVVASDGVTRTLRVDWDGRTLLGGDSPGFLNWDDGVRARAAGVETRLPGGLDVVAGSVEEAVAAASAWFRRRLE